MKQLKLFFFITIVLFSWCNIFAQKQAIYTVQEQAVLDSLTENYLKKGLPEKLAMRRAQVSFERNFKVQTRVDATNWSPNAKPVNGSIWVDRDSITGKSYSFAHNFSPENFVKEIFVKGGKEVADYAIRNVTFRGDGWNPVTKSWTSDGRSLHYFDHGNEDPDVFGIKNGFILSTMDGRRIEGPNENFGDFTSSGGLTTEGAFPNPFRGEDWDDIPTYAAWLAAGGVSGAWPIDPEENFAKDPDLGPIASSSGLSLESLAVLEFDFRSFTDSVSFEFIFASEEFPEYSNSDYNDAFGFFVSGPGLMDQWGNVGDTIDIARYPDGSPIAVNSSNWGFRGDNTFADFDPSGLTPVQTSGYNPPDFVTNFADSNAVNPQYHRPMYDMEPLIEYDGRSILLTAKAKLQKGVWYHMKLAIGDVGDQGLGSGTFLKAGSFDLGSPETNVLKPYIKTPYDSQYGYSSLYMGCENTMHIKVDTVGFDRTIKVWSKGSGASYVYETGSKKNFKDSIEYKIPAFESLIVVNFMVDPKVENGSEMRFLSQIIGGGRDSTELFNLYAKSKTTLKKYTPPTTHYQGVLDVATDYGSPYIQRSLDNGQTWEFARDFITREIIPFSRKQINNIEEDEFNIIYREPNTCCNYDTVLVSVYNGIPAIQRLIVMPEIQGAISNYPKGEYYVSSREDFVFTLVPNENNAGRNLVVTTSRTTVPDSEGVSVVKNADGSFTVTIKKVQEPIEIHVDFVTSNTDVQGGKVWTTGSLLHITSKVAEEASVYRISGSLVQTIKLAAGESISTALEKGFYIVELSGQTHKVVIN